MNATTGEVLQGTEDVQKGEILTVDHGFKPSISRKWGLGQLKRVVAATDSRSQIQTCCSSEGTRQQELER